MDTIHTANPLDLTPKSKTVPENICLLHKMLIAQDDEREPIKIKIKKERNSS